MKGSECLHKTFKLFIENIYWKFICLVEIRITWSQKELVKPQLKSQIYPLEKEIKNSKDHLCSSIWKYESPMPLKLHKSDWKYVALYADGWMAASVVLFSTEYHVIPDRILQFYFGNI
jgi:hypothetical protein